MTIKEFKELMKNLPEKGYIAVVRGTDEFGDFLRIWKEYPDKICRPYKDIYLYEINKV